MGVTGKNVAEMGNFFFEYIVGTCIKRFLLGANKQIRKFEVDIFTSVYVCIYVFSVFLTVCNVGE
jgi:hypothetical protein